MYYRRDPISFNVQESYSIICYEFPMAKILPSDLILLWEWVEGRVAFVDRGWVLKG